MDISAKTYSVLWSLFVWLPTGDARMELELRAGKSKQIVIRHLDEKKGNKKLIQCQTKADGFQDCTSTNPPRLLSRQTV